MIRRAQVLLVVTLSGALSGACHHPAEPGRIGTAASTLTATSVSPMANGQDRARIDVVVRDASGAPLRGQLVQLAVSGAGNVVSQPGISGATGTVTGSIASTSAGTKTVTAIVNPGPKAVTLPVQAEVTFLPAASGPNSTALASPLVNIPANGITTSTVTVTVRDAQGDPAEGMTVLLSASSPSAVLAQPAAVTAADGTASGQVACASPGTVTITATVNPGGRSVTVASQPSVTYVADPLLPDDAEVYYTEVGLSQLRLRAWTDSGASWSGERTTPAPATTPQWLENAFSPKSNFERLLAVLSDTGAATELAMLRFDGATWSTDWTSGAIDRAHIDKRAFDVCYEASSGDAIAVYSNNTATPVFRTRSGGVWSAAQALPLNDGSGPTPDPNTGIVRWVELEARPGANEVALAYADANEDLVVMLWDGAAWATATAQTLSTSLVTNAASGQVHNRAFDLAFEATSGDLLCVWGETTATGFHWSAKAAGQNGWSAAANVNLGGTYGNTNFVDLAMEPTGNRIAAALCDLFGTERLGCATWSGTAWLHAGETDSSMRDLANAGEGDFPAAAGWIGTSGTAVAFYASQTSSQLNWVRWTSGGGWSAPQTQGLPGKARTVSVEAQSFETQNKLMVVLSTDATTRRVYAATTTDAVTWTVTNGGNPLETSVSLIKGKPFTYHVKLQ